MCVFVGGQALSTSDKNHVPSVVAGSISCAPAGGLHFHLAGWIHTVASGHAASSDRNLAFRQGLGVQEWLAVNANHGLLAWCDVGEGHELVLQVADGIAGLGVDTNLGPLLSISQLSRTTFKEMRCS